MPKISAVIITLNEEKNIERCIKSLVDVVDEIVIIDSFSTDKTEEITKKYGARFIKHSFDGHIQQKNWGITQATYPHILSLDADECLSDSLKRSILEVKNNWKYDSYFFNRLTNYCGRWIRHNSWYPSRKLRLWDSRKGKWGGINPHDKYIMNKGATQKFLSGDLLHYSYYSISEHIIQIDKFSTILAKSYFNLGKRCGLFEPFTHPTWRFIRDFFFKLGFLDGFYGLIVCVNTAHEVFLKYTKLKVLWKTYYASQLNTICFFNSSKTWGGGEKWHLDISKNLNSKYNTLVITRKKSVLNTKIKEANLNHYNINIHNLSFINPFKILKLVKYFKKEKVKTLIVNLPSDLKIAAIAAKIAGIKQVIYRRGSAIPIQNSKLNRLIFKYLVDDVIANSIETKNTILQNNYKLFNPDKIKIIYNGIDLHSYKGSYSKLYEKKNDEIIIGNAGRLSEEKGQTLLLEIASILKNKGLNFKLLIAGTGVLEKKLKKIASNLNIEDKVIFLGFVADIKGFNNSIDIFCLSSLFEGFGYVLVEAMAMEKPIVAFDINSSAEIVENNITGYLVNKFDVPEYANKVELLIKNSELRNEFGKAGKIRVNKNFDIQNAITKIEKLIST